MSVVKFNYVFESPYSPGCSDDPNTIISLSDIHWPGKDSKSTAGQRLIEFLPDYIRSADPVALAIPGDWVNSPDLLTTKEERDAFREYIKKITDGRLTIGSAGNHERMVLKNGVWQAEESTILEDTLSSLSNVVLLDNLNSYSLMDPTLNAKGFSNANINFVGGSFPGYYYTDEKETLEAYLRHIIQMFENKQPFQEGMTNIMLLHTVRNLILLLQSGKLPEELFQKLIGVLFASGHEHSGGVLNRMQSFNPFNIGLAAPNGTKLPTHVFGATSCNGVHFVQNGYAGDFKPDSEIINSIYTTFDRGAVSRIDIINGPEPQLKRVRRPYN